MTEAPERIWAQDKTLPGDNAQNGYWQTGLDNLAIGFTEYVRADLPAAVTVKHIDDELRSYKQLDELLCCTGFDPIGQVGCGCQGVTLREEIAHRLSALFTTQPDPVKDAARVDALVKALQPLGLRATVAGWNGENEATPYKPHPNNLGVTLKTNVGTVYAIDAALRALQEGQ